MRNFESETSRTDWVIPGVLLLVGLPCMLISLYLLGDEFLFRRSAVRVPGVVTEVTEGTPSLVVEYAVAGGANQRIETFGSDLYEDVKVGDVVDVFTKPGQPGQGRLDYFTAGWMLPMILGIFGSFFGIPGLIFMRGQLRGVFGGKRPASPVLSPVQKRVRRPVPNARQVQGRVLEIRPVLTMEGFRNRQGTADDMECALSKEGDAWRLLVNGEQQDPFAAHANREWGITYSVVAQWQDSQTGTTHVCESDPVAVEPSFYLQFGTVTVLVDPQDPDNSDIDMGFLPAHPEHAEF